MNVHHLVGGKAYVDCLPGEGKEVCQNQQKYGGVLKSGRQARVSYSIMWNGQVRMRNISDASGFCGEADQVFDPRTEEEIAEILARAMAQSVPVTVMGALTGLAGGAVPQGGWGISLMHFKRLEVQPGFARVGPGVLLRDVRAAAAATGQFYPPDPTEETSSLGGNVAANSSGSRSFKYGATRRYVRALRVVLPDGRIVEYRRGHKVDFDVPQMPIPRVTKLSAGYRLSPGMDYVDLFVGSEGTLGLVTEIELDLIPAPGEILSGVVFFPTEDHALDAVERWRPSPGLRLLEYLDANSLRMVDLSYGAAVMIEFDQAENDGDVDMTGALESESWFGTSASDRERFRQFRHRLPERVNARNRQLGFVNIATDYSVPIEKNRQMLEIYRTTWKREFGGQFVIFGHIGDAHVHTEAFPETQAESERAKTIATELAREAVAMGGSIGAEHGIGKRKSHLLPIQYTPEQIEQMRAVRRRFDPQELLGRGNLFSMEAH
jgi:FAD/FMN-containing dehydrogenase